MSQSTPDPEALPHVKIKPPVRVYSTSVGSTASGRRRRPCPCTVVGILTAQLAGDMRAGAIVGAADNQLDHDCTDDVLYEYGRPVSRRHGHRQRYYRRGRLEARRFKLWGHRLPGRAIAGSDPLRRGRSTNRTAVDFIETAEMSGSRASRAVRPPRPDPFTPEAEIASHTSPSGLGTSNSTIQASSVTA